MQIFSRTMVFGSVAAGVILASGGWADAALRMSVDPVNQTVTFSGSDFGSPNPSGDGSIGAVTWSLPVETELPVSGSIDIGAAVSATSGIAPLPNNSLLRGVTLASKRLEVSIRVNNFLPQTISGTEVKVSYAGLSEGSRQALEELAEEQESISLTLGSGFSAITTRDEAGPTPTPTPGKPVVTIAGPEKVFTTRNRVKLRGAASGTFGILRVEMRVGKNRYRTVRGTTNWQGVVRVDLTKRATPVRVRAVDSRNVRSDLARVRVLRR